MRKKDLLIDFSNVFSSKSQTIIKKRLSKSQKLSPSSYSQPKSPRAMKEFVTNIPKVEKFRQSIKIILTNDNIRNILEKLQIQTTAEREFMQRIKTQQLYITYTDNPLTRQLNNSNNAELSSNSAKHKHDLLNTMNNLSDKSNYSKMKSRLTPVKTQMKDLQILMKKQFELKKGKMNKRDKENIDAVIHTNEARTEYIQNDFEQLDEIIGKRDESFFNRYCANTEKNIFQLIRSKNQENFNSNKEILAKYYFCIDSMIGPSVTQKKKSKFQINNLEGISTFTRELAKGIIPKKIPDKMLLVQGDFNINLQEINFDDLMIIASSKLTSSTLLAFFLQEQYDSKKKGKPAQKQKQLEDEKKVEYAHGTINSGGNFNPKGHEQAEIQLSHRSPYTKFQKQQEAVSKKHFNELKKILEMQADCRTKSIKDKSVMKSFKQQKDETMLKHLEHNVDHRLTNLMKQIERKIRMNKINKNRTQKLKIDLLTESFKMKRRLETSNKKLKPKKEMSFNPSKTSRI